MPVKSMLKKNVVKFFIGSKLPMLVSNLKIGENKNPTMLAISRPEWLQICNNRRQKFTQPLTCRAYICAIYLLKMPKDNSIKSVLIIGSGPIIIGQACEFDYSGSQAARSLREEGIKVILINSNPATIMTDPMMADRVYLLPLTVESIEQILQENQIDAVLPTMGGQRSEERRVGKE